MYDTLPRIGNYVTVKTYIIHDTPLSFTIVNGDGQYFYWHYADAVEYGVKYLCIPVTLENIQRAEERQMTLYEFMKTGPLWVCYVDDLTDTVSIYDGTAKDIEDYFPHPSCYL